MSVNCKTSLAWSYCVLALALEVIIVLICSLSCCSFGSNFAQTIPLCAYLVARTSNVYATQGDTLFPCRPCALDGPSERVGINFETYQKVRTIIRFSSKFTILPFLYLQAIYHLFTIIYYGTSLHRSHVICHPLKLTL